MTLSCRAALDRGTLRVQPFVLVQPLICPQRMALIIGPLDRKTAAALNAQGRPLTTCHACNACQSC